jgi:hypothetical protein
VSEAAPTTEIFWEIHSNLPREGPGDDTSTRTAFFMLTDLPKAPRILDVGCGPGMQTLSLRGSLMALLLHWIRINRFSIN